MRLPNSAKVLLRPKRPMHWRDIYKPQPPLLAAVGDPTSLQLPLNQRQKMTTHGPLAGVAPHLILDNTHYDSHFSGRFCANISLL